MRLNDVASVYCNDIEFTKEIINIPIHKTSESKENDVISVLEIIRKIQEVKKDINIKTIGSSEILINIKSEKEMNKGFQYIKVAFVCLILFLGAGIAIINFHEDVNMEKSMQTFYRIVTGKKSERPLILHIPYSLGIGIGMVTFFNHIFKKKNKKEPSPLDVEMYMYSKNIDEYVLDITKQNNKTKID